MPYYGLIGIISIEGNIRDQYPLVQSRCHYNIADVYSIAELVQDYHSSAPISRDVEYVFPLPPGAAVCSFKAVIDDKKTIKGVVKEKGQAKTEYKAAVAQGKTAGLLEQEHPDVFRVSLGNIKPNQKISVHISFISIVTHDASSPQTLRITMPTSIAPRYGSPPTNIPWWKPNNHNRFDLTVAIQMNKAVTSVSSPSHPIGLTLGCAEKELKGDFEPSKAFVYLGDSAFLEKDIVVVISAQGLDVPRCSVERWLASEGAEETTDAYALTLVPKFDLPPLPNQEYIFLVDRSGSMEGGRMESVKASLQIMLRSLPSRDTTFNIVSFGSSYSSLWPTSQAYSAESVEQASKHVDTFSANFGGTELRSAIQFALKGRTSAKSYSKDAPPTSVFVLTDGEAWDLDGVLHEIYTAVKAAKANKSLLRTFVLGVGNEVSTAMCEGIARAGQGTAVYVAEREKPDAKLMGLLRAARGGVIENLAVEWGSGANEKEVMELDDEFEVVSKPGAPQTAAKLPPLNLFDDQSMNDAPELGPNKAVVNLPPPPVIQQAPKSDKLPIPLYPGFRCSIFAIIKQGSNPGPHSPHIKLTGNVLGRDVTLQVPVSSVNIGSPLAKDVGVNKMLHTLAAKALIQEFEDMATTPETKAQIERLGKRYSLASSVTSFLAIDEEDHVEKEATVEKEKNPAPPELSEPSSSRPGLMASFSFARKKMAAPAMPTAMPAPMIPPPRPVAFSTKASAITTGSFMPSLGSSSGPPPPPMMYQQAQMQMQQAAAMPRSRPLAAQPTGFAPGAGGYGFGAPPAAAAPMPTSISNDLLASYSADLSLGGTVPLPDEEEEEADEEEEDMGFGLDDFAPAAPAAPASYSYGSAKAPAPTSLSVESLARAQKFDGSFPTDSQHISLVTSGGTLSLPSALSGLGGPEETKKAIWATLLTIACLEKRLAGEKDVWEFLADKARDYISATLQDLCKDAAKAEALMKELTAAATAAV
ncbi:hypothetical protein CPB86DRAFT_760872 [Serendipita vermifera]|nr:hypothetical protein CPB86DRAFT_760872 [Serendipita vermifera]